ncbi:hypothetical protein [Halorubrum californiense]|nr:hypothetical protein [Halorubrum californiense]
MGTKRLSAGILLSVTGLAIFFLDTGFEFAGPQLPDTALGYVGWGLLLLGVGLLRTGTSK